MGDFKFQDYQICLANFNIRVILMAQQFFVIKCNPLNINKKSIFDVSSQLHELGSYIKAISDTFFLSNNFRSDIILYFITKYQETEYRITFNGNDLRYLGPSFFSAAHLLLRALTHTKQPRSKKGRLTPGLSIRKSTIEDIFNTHENIKKFRVVRSKEIRVDNKLDTRSQNMFIFNYTDGGNNQFSSDLSLGNVEIDEQIILLNYYLDKSD